MNSPFPDIVFDPLLPAGAVWLLGALFLAGTIAAAVRVSATLSTAQRAVLLLFRCVGVAAILLLLLQPSRLEKIPPAVNQRLTFIAVDDSRSMAQKDTESGARTEAAKALLHDAELVTAEGAPANAETRLFKFSNEAVPINSVAALHADGATTRLHDTVNGLLSSLHPNEGVNAIILLSDGHDLELVNPAKTGFAARSRQAPIFAVPVGRTGKVRDVAVRITSFQPYCYVRQKARISAVLRPIGCELETLQVELLRGEQVVQTLRVAAGEEPEIPVAFEVSEPAVGQFEYEVRVRPLPEELDVQNNHAITFLNVIDQQIQVLVLEGSPYWDTSFLQRSLMRNDKMNVDVIAQYARGKARRVRKKAEGGELKLPETAAEWRRYDVVVLGRAVDEIIGAEGVRQLEEYVKTGGGAVVFSRGRAFENPALTNDLEPVIWGSKVTEHVRLDVSREGQSLPPFRALKDPTISPDAMPQLIAAHSVAEKKPLAAALAVAQGANGDEPAPGFIHRRFGEGQVLSIGVDGLWRWAFNAKVEGLNTVFDRFWDQMILWLLAGRDFLPTQQYSLRADSANIALGDTIRLRAVVRDASAGLQSAPVSVQLNGAEVGRVTLSRSDASGSDKLSGEFAPPKTGKYTAVAQFPDGTKQSAHFIVYDDNVEQTEVAADTNYLRKLCESSGGRLLRPDELKKAVAEFHDRSAESAPTVRLQSVWDRAWVFWAIGLAFGADWYLRRRWGLC